MVHSLVKSIDYQIYPIFVTILLVRDDFFTNENENENENTQQHALD